MPNHFRLSLETTEVTAPLIALLRRHTGKPISELSQAIKQQQPFLDESPHHNQYSEFIEQVTKLLDDLEAQGIRYLVEMNGSPESPQYLRNVFQLWHDIGEETKWMTYLESGEPDIETLEWLRQWWDSDDVFQTTLRQIIAGAGYTCDEETIAWASRELEAAE